MVSGLDRIVEEKEKFLRFVENSLLQYIQLKFGNKNNLISIIESDLNIKIQKNASYDKIIEILREKSFDFYRDVLKIKSPVESAHLYSFYKVLTDIFWETTWKNKNLGSISQAGLVNNLNDGMIWGLFPILLASLNFNLEQIGVIVAVYPTVWGLGQLFTGKLADILPKKQMLFWGMFVQGLALYLMTFSESLSQFIILSVILGLGTAFVYPTFLAGIAEYTNPKQRAESIGIFRLWRDLGYAIGAILTGVVADSFGILYSVKLIAILTIVSSIIILVRMENKEKS